MTSQSQFSYAGLWQFLSFFFFFLVTANPADFLARSRQHQGYGGPLPGSEHGIDQDQVICDRGYGLGITIVIVLAWLPVVPLFWFRFDSRPCLFFFFLSSALHIVLLEFSLYFLILQCTICRFEDRDRYGSTAVRKNITHQAGIAQAQGNSTGKWNFTYVRVWAGECVVKVFPVNSLSFARKSTRNDVPWWRNGISNWSRDLSSRSSCMYRYMSWPRREVTWPTWDLISSSGRVVPGQFFFPKKRELTKKTFTTPKTHQPKPYHIVKLHFLMEFPLNDGFVHSSRYRWDFFNQFTPLFAIFFCTHC